MLLLCSQAIFAQEPKMTGSAWVDISDEAKGFVKQLLNKCAASLCNFELTVSVSTCDCMVP